MNAEIEQDITFEAAHFLPRVPPGHKCRRMHGHSYKVTIKILGEINPDTGWVIDFFKVEELVKPVHDQLDHHLLNEVPGLENPTSENIAVFIWDKLSPNLRGLAEIVVHETCTSRASYRGGR